MNRKSIKLRGNLINSSVMPDHGDFVISPKFGKVKLVELIDQGGEGRIFETDTGHAVKIYFSDKLTSRKYQKLKQMVDKAINIKGICWPISLIYSEKGSFVGYLMPKANGKPMQKCMFVPPLIAKYFPHWNRKHLVQLAITWLEKVVFLHRQGVIIGDINPLNFLLESENSIYFVDTDSYQFDDFPCPVGTINFTAPEIQGSNFSTFLRTNNHENFAVATLIFMILMPGKTPYSHIGGESPKDNIIKGVFSYPLGERSNKKTPNGPWRFIWSHFPYRVKKAFFECFNENKRLSSSDWLLLMRQYKYALDENHLDPEGESEKILPKRHKLISEYAKDKFNAGEE